MREIKFRGKRVDNGEWVYGYLVCGEFIGSIIMTGEYHANSRSEDSDGFTNYEVIPETVGQYAGLQDKNNKDIYEGDKTKRGYVIMWSERLALFCEHYFRKYYKDWSEVSYPLDSDSIEIVGNIYENTNLLTQ